MIKKVLEALLIVAGVCFIIGIGYSEQRKNDKTITSINNIQYKGHDYICFYNKYNHNFSVVHSPDCRKCLQMFD